MTEILFYIGLIALFGIFLGNHVYKMRGLHLSVRKVGLQFSHSFLWTSFEITGQYKDLQVLILSQIPFLSNDDSRIFFDSVQIYLQGQKVWELENFVKRTASDTLFFQGQLDHAVEKYKLKDFDVTRGNLTEDLPRRNKLTRSYNIVLYIMIVIIILGLAIQA